MAEQFIMTQEGYDEAVKKLDYLTKVKRAEIVERIAEARSHGDLSENAEYDAARNEQAANESEIIDLEFRIKNAYIPSKENVDVTAVHLGSVVTVYDAEMGEEQTYTIKGSTEVNILKGIISGESPVGKALVGHRKGDTVNVPTPDGGSYQLKIIDVR